MKIKYNENAAPHLRGTTAHVPPALAASLVATGFAEAQPRARYGTKEWLDERREMSEKAVPHKDDVNPGYVSGVEWGVRDRIALNGQILVIKRSGHETFYYEEANIPKDCPSSIIDKFVALKNGPVVAAEARADAKRKQDAYNASLQGKRRW